VKKIIAYPLLFALFPVLKLFEQNKGDLLLTEVLNAGVVLLLCAALLWYVVNRVVRDPDKAALLLFTFEAMLLTFGHVLNWGLFTLASTGYLETANAFMRNPTSQQIAAWLWLGLGVVAGYPILRARVNLRVVSQFLNVFCLTLVMMLVGSWLMWRIQESPSETYVNAWNDSVNRMNQAEPLTAPAANRPNIFYIILDEYAREDILRTLYQHDNSDFYAFLRKRGFYVADHSVVNYSQTQLSLASSLNSIYLDEVATRLDAQSVNRHPLNAMIDRNRLFPQLRAQGYTIVTFASGFGATEFKTADHVFAPSAGLSEFEQMLFWGTPLPTLFPFPFIRDDDAMRRERILYAFDHLPQATQHPSPVFVFAHILAPHPPFLFHAQGEPAHYPRVLSASSEGIEMMSVLDLPTYLTAYREQTMFITARVQMLVDEILANASEPVIIILQSDHGPGAAQLSAWDETTVLRERMSILNAIYFPDGDYRALYPSITPVNTFRIILNQYFGARHEILPDENFFSLYASLTT